MKAEILAIGTELLMGEIVNTNAQFLAEKLVDLGIYVYHQSVVGDNEERIMQAYELAFSRSDLLIVTGGLGPTKDDMTKEVAAKFFKRELVLHPESLEIMKTFFDARNLPLNEGNIKQAYFPIGAKILPNPNGTAPGCMVEEGGKTFILLPGPPREMIPMYENHVVPHLKPYQKNVLVSKVLHIVGIGEGHMVEKIEDIIDGQNNPTVAPYAKAKGLTLRITASGQNQSIAEGLIKPVQEAIQERLGEDVYGEGDITLEEVVAKKLIEKKQTIAIAESCTGGMLSGRLTNYPGISSVFMEAMITYSNEAKIKRLDVSPQTIENYGAVSEETAKEMAIGMARTANADIGLSVTGIAGPGGGTVDKPVGLVYIGLYLNGQMQAKKLIVSGDRQRVRKLTTTYALDFLRRQLMKV
ncbi:competence/damage-inducible protein CinA [Alkaliphilus metalliredigens QYMF]|uniref:Putative competence-damage inducible protein n=1 Tax=Alkaliphilus metalliredigens (strain QYMF) TaxID=293826 RepID=CINA_ALKMQ|nr:competence/damage-inducible protein A [Alkaliphilus metalliredigens]A6TNW2.1 RecName: Full=Putative competence-damage inducible protein [Alkaliphilus metalliredigens QYMF]ABR47880.1 competence/damage-inducible protein CinA [Alkaliphilus metalliredigens QYMF]